METELRLQKYLAAAGVASRRGAEEMIAAGRVAINGRVIREMGTKVRPEQDRVTVDGVLISAAPRSRYILLFKPAGYICSCEDERGRRTVLDLLSGVEERVYPVGRLDYDTSGLLLLTNDGALTQSLLHPSRLVDKTYAAEVKGVPTGQALEQLRRGLRLEDGMTAPAQVRVLRRRADGALLELTIHEGRNRQVRRMLEAVNLPVLHLKRVRFAFLDLSGLQPGEWRDLTGEEVSRLKNL